MSLETIAESTAAFEAQAVSLIEAAENYNYDLPGVSVVNGHATIGYGYDLTQHDAQSTEDFLSQAIAADAPAQQSSDNEFVSEVESYYTGTTGEELKASGYTLSQPAAMRLLNEVLWTGDPSDSVASYDAGLTTALPVNVPDSGDRAVLLSLWFQAGSKYIGPGITTALSLANPGEAQADAWYEIRYDSNGNALSDIAGRMYAQSQLFGLYGNIDPSAGPYPDLSSVSKTIADDDSAAVYQMYTANHDSIVGYDETWMSSASVAGWNTKYASVTGSIQSLDTSLTPASSYLNSLFDNTISGLAQDDVWASPDASSQYTTTAWTSVDTTTSPYLILIGTGNYTGLLWSKGLVPTTTDLYVAGDSGTGSNDVLQGLGSIQGSSWSNVQFDNGNLWATLTNQQSVEVDGYTSTVAISTSESADEQLLSDLNDDVFSFGADDRPATGDSPLWQMSVDGSDTLMSVQSSVGIYFQGPSTGDDDGDLSGAGSSSGADNGNSSYGVTVGPADATDPAIAPTAEVLVIGGTSADNYTIDTSGITKPALGLGLSDGVNLIGKPGDTLVATGANETFSVNEGNSSPQDPTVLPVTMIGGAIEGASSASTSSASDSSSGSSGSSSGGASTAPAPGDIFKAGTTSTIMIGSSGSDSFYVTGSQANEGQVYIIWGDGGDDNYYFFGDVEVEELNISDPTAADVASLNLQTLPLTDASYDDLSAFGPTVVVIDASSTDTFYAGTTKISSGGFISSEPDDSPANGLTEYDYENGVGMTGVTDTNGDTYTHYRADYTVLFQDFQQGLGGVTAAGLPTVGAPTLSSASADGQTLSASSGVSDLVGNGHNVQYDLSTPPAAAVAASTSVMGRFASSAADSSTTASDYPSHVTIDNEASASTTNAASFRSTLNFIGGVQPDQVAVYVDSEDNLVFDDTADNIVATVTDGGLGADYSIGQVTFSDGTTWSESQISDMISQPSSYSTTIASFGGETLDGKGVATTAVGSAGGDTFVFDQGYGDLEINEADPAGSPANTLAFGTGIDPSDIFMYVENDALVLVNVVSGDQVTVDNMALGDTYGVQNVTFADGTVWTRADITQMLNTGTTGDDALFGLNQGETFDGMGGDDYAQGAGGGDTFVFDPGYGQLEIYEQDSGAVANTLAFGAGIDPSEISTSISDGSLVLTDGTAGDQVTLDGMASGPGLGVQNVTFADGTVWTSSEIAQTFVTGTSGNDDLTGIQPGLTYDGKGGDDYAQGMGGGDTFVFDAGYGRLEISEIDRSANPDNTLAFGSGIDPSDVQVSTNGDAVVLTDGISGDQVTLDDMVNDAFAGLQEVTFADGTVWTLSTIAEKLATGTSGNDNLIGIQTDLTYDGKGGNDYAQGLGGGDTFVFDAGYGQLEINENDYSATQDNTLAFGKGIDPADAQASLSGSAVVLTDGISGDQVTLDNMASTSNSGVQAVTFADGTVWTRSTIAEMLVTGTSGNDRLIGIDLGLTYDGKGGNDYAQGRSGDDTFVFDPGYGQLEVNEGDYLGNTLAFGAGIDPTAVQVSVSGGAVILTDGVSGDQVTLDNMASSTSYGVQNVTFADGTTWTRATLAEMLITGTTGDDNLIGIQRAMPEFG